MSYASQDFQPILTITTLKNWVLPPRPKNARKAKAPEKKKLPAAKTPAAPAPPRDTLECAEDLHSNIRSVDRENYQLKTKLLLLIHDYKSLRVLVMSPALASALPPLDLYDSATTARKRLFNEMGDPMNDLISNMNDLSYRSPGTADDVATELFDFVNLDTDLDALAVAEEFGDEDIDDDLDSHSLSRLVSPTTSEADENSLMSSLTRSTTVLTNNLTFDRKQLLHFKFYDLPTYSEDEYAFLFAKINPHDKMMSVIEEDHYNQVADFLEEKLLSNDVKYYVEKSQSLGR